MPKLISRTALAVAVVFFLPALLSLAYWAIADRPANWRSADWSSAGILGPASADPDAAIYVMAARTGGMKGALSVHSWIVLKRPGQADYDRFEKVGWGLPVRRNAFEPDGRWYSNEPYIVTELHGERAGALIPLVERAIAQYPGNRRGDYALWPGPNSNSFVSHILHSVPEIGAALPSLAIGRDFLPGRGFVTVDPDGREIHVSLFGLLGFAAGVRSGIEIHLLGLVAGFDATRLAIKLPGFGEITL